GHAENPTGASRLGSGLGSGRYDFYRVSLDLYRAHPVGGIGADNFADDYLVRRHFDETPTYPHSIEMRTLEGTGTIGALLLAAALGERRVAGPARRLAPRTRAIALAGAAVAAVAVLLTLAGPWFAARQVDRAARTWTADPRAALDRLDQAASWNPLSSRPWL